MNRARGPFRSSFLFIVMLLLAVSYIGAVSFTGGPAWSWQSNGPYTNDTLYCNWSFTPDAQMGQNITVLVNGTVNWTLVEPVASTTGVAIPASWTTKTDNWTCVVMLFNTSDALDNRTVSTSIKILNSPPTTEAAGNYGVFIGGTDIGYLYPMVEHGVYYLQAIAFDADNDTPRYQPSSDFCVLTNATTGNYTCRPGYTDIAGNAPTIVPISFSASDGLNIGGRTVNFNITPVNDPPNFTNIANKSTPLNVTYNMDFTVADEEGNYPIHYAMHAPYPVNDTLSLTTLNAQGTSFRITYNSAGYSFSNVGSWRINVTATDNSTNYTGGNDSKSANASFLLNITNIGRPPNYFNYTANLTGWTGGVINITQGQPVRINYTANDTEANATIHFFVYDPGNSLYFDSGTHDSKNNTNDSQYAKGYTDWTPTNDEVGVYNITVGAKNYPAQLANVTPISVIVRNVNDPPVIYRFSYDASNSLGESDSSALVAYANTPFVYVVNATDPDLRWGDAINFTNNMTGLFTINRTTGEIRFTPDDSMVGGPYDINITVTDNGSGISAPMSAERVFSITVNANTPPGFNATIPPLRCTTKAECGYDLANSTFDLEDGTVTLYNVTVASGTTAIGTPLLVGYDPVSGLINFTTKKTDVGNYTLLVTLYDQFGASNATVVNLTINNTPEPPAMIDYNISLYRIVVSHPLANGTPLLRAMDDDLLLPYLGETVTFTTNLTGRTTGANATIVPMANGTPNTSRAQLLFTPGTGDNGTYTIEINATDSFGFSDRKVLSFTVYPKAGAPNITRITPWGDSAADYAIQTTDAYTNASQFSGRIAYVNLSEGTTVKFNITVNDTSPINSYAWTVDGVAQDSGITNTTNLTHEFGYFSAGNHTVGINVTNDFYESAAFTWRLNVKNVNQPPKLLRNLTNLELNRSRDIAGYFYDSHYNIVNETSPHTRFIDPDDDVNSNDIIDEGVETNTLKFNTTGSCTFADLGISGTDLSVVVKSVGYCIVYFNATDRDGATLESNPVLINVTAIDNGTSPTPQTGGGGGSSSIPTVVPITKKYLTPKAFNLLAPKLTTIYNNKSVDIPITINNTWTTPLKMLKLRAEANATGVNMSFDTDIFEEIPVNQSREVILTVSNYRLGQNYEVKVIGNTTVPPFEDTALILLNSIESTSEGDEVNVKVTFANDLVNEHPECLELNEVLDQAKKRISDGNLAEGKQLVDSVINGCKYLVGVQQNNQEKPSKLNPIISIDNISVKAIMFGVLAFVVLSTIAFIVYYHYTHKVEDDI